MRRFFLEDIDEGAKEAEITGEEFTHLRRVLRLGPGDDAAIFNGRGLELTARIESVSSRSARLTIIGKNQTLMESPFKLLLLQALLKGDKPEFIIQKTTELGVSAVCFYATARTVSKVDEENAEKKLLRWKKAAIEAAKQCGRNVLPDIAFAQDLRNAVESIQSDLKLLLWEREGARPLRELLSGKRPESVAVIVGPEGGFSDADAATAEKAGFVKVSMGPRILRAETAAIATAATMQYAFGDLG